MSAAELREAAALMRSRAEAATPGRWEPWESAVEIGCFSVGVDGGAVVADPVYPVDAEHIASWHPAVALAVAAWLDICADFPAFDVWANPQAGGKAHLCKEINAALAVARSYLGRSA